MATQQELLDTVYSEFVHEVEELHLDADMSAVAVVDELTRALFRVVGSHGATAMRIDGENFTEAQLAEHEL